MKRFITNSKLRIKIFIDILFNKFQGAQDDPPVMAGLDAILYVDGKEVGWATNVSFDEDFEIQGIRTLGVHGDRGYKSQGYNCTVTVGTFVLEQDVDDNLPIPSKKTILTSGSIDMEVLDTINGTTLYILKVQRIHKY